MELSMSNFDKLFGSTNSKYIIKEVKKKETVLYNIVTDDNMWCYQWDLETKRQSAKWKALDEPNSQKLAKSKV